ncbi:formate dehydrogenase accessory sulfurtransferase FdhD [Comamonas sp.]
MTDASACPIDTPDVPALTTSEVRFHHAERGVLAEQRVLANEVPIALVFNGISHAVMMGTPLDLEDFAIGFALSEGIIDSAADCYGVEVRCVAAAAAGLPEGMDGMEVQLDISSRCFMRLKDHRRSMSGRTGCGVCGVESFAALDLSFDALPARDWVAQVDLPTVLTAINHLPPKQLLNAEAGAIHAAGWATLDGQVHDVIEDVGRHNALDKLLGRLARTGRLGEPGFVVLSSRGSHELVRKCAKLGIAALATISAPTAMGVRMAELTGLRFWGLCRPPKATLYAAGSGWQLDSPAGT